MDDFYSRQEQQDLYFHLREKGLTTKKDKKVKILNNGKLEVKVSLNPEISISKSTNKLFTDKELKGDKNK